MTNGGLMQLVAYGAQDVYLTANPQVTFFKQLYRRHSNFALESIEQTFNGVANFGKRVQCTIARNGDLIHKVYLQATLPQVQSSDVSAANCSTFSWVRNIGQALVEQVEVEIGGQLIDRQYGEWLYIWNELTLPVGKQLNYNRITNAVGGLTLRSGAGSCLPCASDAGCSVTQASELVNSPYFDSFNNAPALADPSGDEDLIFAGVCPGGVELSSTIGCLPETTLYIPLEFWFCRHAGLALPLIALQYHEVKINVDFEDIRYLVNAVPKVVGGNNTQLVNSINSKGLVACSLWVDYVYLDTEERRRFAQVAHEYLIEQLQYTGAESLTSTSNKIRMQFNHPCKELVWVVQNPNYADCNSQNNNPFCYTDLNCGNPTAVAKIQLNGQDRFTERDGSYFNFVQPYQHHTNSPTVGINVYSFALKPEDLQPSGSCNFSRIDNATLNLTLTPETFKADNNTGYSGLQTPAVTNVSNRIYATNYNVLRIMSGMGGLAYSN
jgi:Large eukaryotic DNA virus major capsid protein/Major capsid protein N-terminus